MKKRKILFITGSRSDFYIQKPILDAVKKSNFLSLLLIVAGSHLSKKFGFTINEILKEKYNIVAKIKNLVVSDNPVARLKSASKQLSNLVVRCLILKHTEENSKIVSKGKYQDEIDYLVRSKSRQNFISNLSL